MTVSSKVKQTLASLKGIEATLRIYSLQSQSREVSDVFSQSTGIVEEIINDLEGRVQFLELEEPQYKGL
jgi:hypothetical protein